MHTFSNTYQEQIDHHQNIVYHIYPLGYAGFVDTNAVSEPDRPSLTADAPSPIVQIINDLSRLQELGINMLYIGPVFSSEKHGYDTIDYHQIDSRLGSGADFSRLVSESHERGMRVIIDTVFNHVSRSFSFFQDLLNKKTGSAYLSWFHGIDFNRNNPYGDGFDYQTWDGHYELVKLNLTNQDVSDYLVQTALTWIREYDIDGLRIDAADVMDTKFLRYLSDSCRKMKPDFFIVGEQVHGLYNRLIQDACMDSVTNYECYKGFYSSLNDGNYHEIAYALDRQFKENGGLYTDCPLFNFTDNHDVDRVTSVLKTYAHVYPLYIMLFTIPGIPVLYYGDEYGAKGKRTRWSDLELRKSMEIIRQTPDHDLYRHIQNMAAIRKEKLPLTHGTFKNVHIAAKQYCFLREYQSQRIYCCFNSSMEAAQIPAPAIGTFVDILNNETLQLDGKLLLYPNWGRILIPA